VLINAYAACSEPRRQTEPRFCLITNLQCNRQNKQKWAWNLMFTQITLQTAYFTFDICFETSQIMSSSAKEMVPASSSSSSSSSSLLLIVILLHYNSGRVLAFSTTAFHLRRSWTFSVHLTSFILLMPFLTSSSYRGLPTGLSVNGFHLCILLTIIVYGILFVCPNQLNLWDLT
jgi:hypothetical protein